MKTQKYLGFEIQKQEGGGFRILENGADVTGWCPNYKTATRWIEEIICDRDIVGGPTIREELARSENP